MSQSYFSAPRIQFAVYFPAFTGRPSELWERFADFLAGGVGLPEHWQVMCRDSDKWRRPSLKNVGATIDLESDPRFLVTTVRPSKGPEVQLSLMPPAMEVKRSAREQSEGWVLWCSSYVSGERVVSTWTPLIESIASHWPVRLGVEWDQRYASWQRCIWEDNYIRDCGPLPTGFKKQFVPSIDGIGRDRVRLDTSTNPGRSCESLLAEWRGVTASMWLGPHFWQYAACTKKEVLAADIFLEKRETPDFLYLKSWPEPFTRPEGEQGRVQRKLWQLLFNEDCEWPPGTGGISDVPVYGPPDLIPKAQ